MFLFAIESIVWNLLSLWQSADDVRISWIGDGQCAHAEVFTASGTQFDVVAAVVVDAGLGQHSVVLDFGLSVIDKR